MQQRADVVHAVRSPTAPTCCDGDLHSPRTPRASVIFAHGSGSSRFSSRNRQVAESLHGRFATLLLRSPDARRRNRSTSARRNIASTSRGWGVASSRRRTGQAHHPGSVSCRSASSAPARARGGADCGRGTADRGRGLARRAAGPRRRRASNGPGADPAHRRRRRRSGDRAQRGGDAAHACTGRTRHRAARDAPLRGAGHIGGGAAAGARLVHAPHGTLTGIRCQVSGHQHGRSTAIRRSARCGARAGVASCEVRRPRRCHRAGASARRRAGRVRGRVGARRATGCLSRPQAWHAWSSRAGDGRDRLGWCARAE